MRNTSTKLRVRQTLLWVMILASVFGAAEDQTAPSLQLTLGQAIDLALKQNRTLRLAKLSVMESESKKEIARASYFPHIKNESSVLHITELAGVEIPAGAFGVHSSTGPIPAKNLLLDQGALTTYTSGTGLTQPLTQMLKIHAANRAAAMDVDIAKTKVSQAENEIVLKVRQLYYGIAIAQLRQQAAMEEVLASEAKDEESKSAVTEGRALDVAYLESHAAMLDAKQAALAQKFQIDGQMRSLNNLLGLPINTQLQLSSDTDAGRTSILSREECIQTIDENNPEIQAAKGAVLKAKAGVSAAKYAYVPDVTGVARYSYQSGVPFLVHNFGTFGAVLSYDLFDGGRRKTELEHSRTLLSEAELNLTKVRENALVQMQAAYDKVEQLQAMVLAAKEAMSAREELARVAGRQFEQHVVLISARAGADAKASAAKASYLEAVLGLSLAQADLKRTIGQLPR